MNTLNKISESLLFFTFTFDIIKLLISYPKKKKKKLIKRNAQKIALLFCVGNLYPNNK